MIFHINELSEDTTHTNYKETTFRLPLNYSFTVVVSQVDDYLVGHLSRPILPCVWGRGRAREPSVGRGVAVEPPK